MKSLLVWLLTLTCVAIAPATPTRAQTSAGASPQEVAASATASRPGARLRARLAGYKGSSEFHGRAALIALSPDATLVATSGGDGKVNVWDAADGKLRYTLSAADKNGLSGFAFSPDGQLVAARERLDKSVRLYDARTGRELHALPGRDKNLESKFKAATLLQEVFAHVPFSPDGRRVLVERADDVVEVYDAASGERAARLEHDTNTSAVKDTLKLLLAGSVHLLVMQAHFSPDGRRIVTANGDDAPKLWDDTGKLVAALAAKGERLYYALFSADSRLLVTAGVGARVRVWEAETGRSVATLGEAGAALFSPDGKTVTTFFRDRARLWDAATGEQRRQLTKSDVRALAFSPDGSLVVTAGDDDKAAAKVWDAATGELKYALPKGDGRAEVVGFAAEGRMIVTANDKGLKLWRAADGAPHAALTEARFPFAMSRDARLLATGGRDGAALLWEIEQ